MSIRKFGTCLACLAIGDETEKEIHAIGLCEKHYKQHLRNRPEGNDGTRPLIDDDKWARRALKAHAFIAEKFQKFLHALNHEHVTMLIAAEQLHEIRLLVTPFMVRSQRFTAPRALPDDMTSYSPLEVLEAMRLDRAMGDTSPENFDGDLSPEQKELAEKYRQARHADLTATLVRSRRRSHVATEIIDRGFQELSTEAATASDNARYSELTAAVQQLKSYLARDVAA